jgi:hypothetical protein
MPSSVSIVGSENNVAICSFSTVATPTDCEPRMTCLSSGEIEPTRRSGSKTRARTVRVRGTPVRSARDRNDD